MRLRTLTEAECYARCYGGHSDERVSVVRLRRAAAPRSTGAASACASCSRSGSTRADPRPRPLDARLPHLDGAAAARLPRRRAARRRRCRARGCARRRGRSVVPRCKPRGRKHHLVRRPGRPRARTCAASSAGSTRAASRPPRRRTSRTRATTSGGCSTTRASRRGSSTRRSSSRCSSSAIGVTNAACRTTPGSGDLRRGDFDRGAARARRARAAAARDRLRRQGGLPRRSSTSGPSSARSCATLGPTGALRAAVDLARERRRPVRRAAALVPRAARVARAGAAAGGARARLDADDRVLLVQFENPVDAATPGGATPGGGIEPGESDEAGAAPRAARGDRARASSSSGPLVWTRERTFPWARRLLHQHERVLPRARRRARAARRRSTSRRRASTATAGGRSTSSSATDERVAPPELPRARVRTILERRDRGPRHRPPARRERLGRRLDRARLRRRPGDPHARGRAARPRDEGARPALAPARLRRAARRRR